WVLQKKGVTSPIVGASKVEQLTDAVAALSIKLTDEEIKMLEAPYVPHHLTKFRQSSNEGDLPMILYVLAYLGGVLTIVSPCILPVIPFVLARADRPFLKNGLPMLVGMTLAFAVVASFASVAGGWVVSANQYGRVAALVLLAVFGLTLLFPELADRLMRPLVVVGARLSQSGEQPGEETLLAPLVLGIATGFLWAPCAGPVLGLILTG